MFVGSEYTVLLWRGLTQKNETQTRMAFLDQISIFLCHKISTGTKHKLLLMQVFVEINFYFNLLTLLTIITNATTKMSCLCCQIDIILDMLNPKITFCCLYSSFK